MWYNETYIYLPRSLKGFSTAIAISKIMELNCQLQKDDCYIVTTDVSGHLLFLAVFREKDENFLLTIKELNCQEGKILTVPEQKNQITNTLSI